MLNELAENRSDGDEIGEVGEAKELVVEIGVGVVAYGSEPPIEFEAAIASRGSSTRARLIFFVLR